MDGNYAWTLSDDQINTPVSAERDQLQRDVGMT